MEIKSNIMNVITKHPQYVTLGIGLAVTFVVGIAIGTIDHNTVFAAHPYKTCTPMCN